MTNGKPSFSIHLWDYGQVDIDIHEAEGLYRTANLDWDIEANEPSIIDRIGRLQVAVSRGNIENMGPIAHILAAVSKAEYTSPIAFDVWTEELDEFNRGLVVRMTYEPHTVKIVATVSRTVGDKWRIIVNDAKVYRDDNDWERIPQRLAEVIGEWIVIVAVKLAEYIVSAIHIPIEVVSISYPDSVDEPLTVVIDNTIDPGLPEALTRIAPMLAHVDSTITIHIHDEDLKKRYTD